MDLKLKNVHVLVTGASGGIGLATCLEYLRQGANVTAQYNTTSSTLEPVLAEYGPERVRSVQANLIHEEDVSRMISQQSTVFGPVQILVANHGYFPQHMALLAEMTLEQWNTTITANITSTFLVIKEYLNGLKTASEPAKAFASVIIVGSVGGKYGAVGHADYASAKSGMMYGLTMSLKNEIVKIAPRARVNVIAPGFVKTQMVSQFLGVPEALYMDLGTTPLKKIATPEDVATQIVIASSSAVSGHLNGQIIAIDGGMEGRVLNKFQEIDFNTV